MLTRIVQFSLRFRGVVLALACVILFYGFYVALHAKLDVFPNFVQPQATIQIESPGLSPEQVEALVTRPIESAVNGLGNMASLRSESIQGLSVITAVFKEGTDIYIARQMLAERLAAMAGELPVGVQAPRMTPLTSSTMVVLEIGLVSDKLSPMELRTFAEWTLQPRLLAASGVAHCNIFGGEVRQLQIQVKPDRLRAFNLSIQDVLNAAREATGVRGAGFIETANARINLQTEGQLLTSEQLGEVVITQHDGQSVRMKDVADVVWGAQPKFGDALVQGRPGIIMTIMCQYGANTMDVTKTVETALNEMKPELAKEDITLYPQLHRPATFITNSLRNILHSLLLGAALVAVVLFLFLGHFRTAFISVTAIPLSLLTAIILLDKFGVTLNTITLGGLAIAIGEVVDDAIIDVENIFRRLRENQVLAEPRPVFRVVLEASLEVRSAVIYATFIVVLVFLPVLTLTGLQGSFFAPLALSYIFAILASLGVALTLTPALAYFFFEHGVRDTRETQLQSGLKSRYGHVLNSISKWPRTVMALMVVACLTSLALLPFLSGGLLPDFREGHFVAQLAMSPGTSLPEMLRVGRIASLELLKNPNIATVDQQAGRAEQGEDPFGPERSELHIELKPHPTEDEDAIADEIRAVLAKMPGIQFDVMTFLGDRIGETVSGETSPVVINLYGDDLDVLDAKAREVAGILRSLHGAAEVQIKSLPGAARLSVRLRPDRLTQFGFRSIEVLDAIQTAYQGAIAGQTYEGNRFTDVSVILGETDRQNLESVGDLMVNNSQGLQMPLRELADVHETTGRFSISHDGNRRRQTVTCNPHGVDVTTFTATAQKAVAAQVSLPRGVYLEFSGASAARAAAQRQLLLHSALAAMGILILLSVAFCNWRHLLLVLANVPFALVGGVLAVWLISLFSEPGEGALTLGAMVGFVTLFGITMRNSIMMISHFEHLVNEEGMTWGLEAALRGAAERLVPILMTALVTGLGLLPLALGSGEAGREIEGPMAIVILGGLVTSTALNLLVLPTLALRYGRFGGIKQN